PERMLAIMSSISANPEPFQYPIGNALCERSISAGSCVSSPARVKPPGTGSISPFNRYDSIAPYENCDMAISSTTCPSFRGTAMITGLLPSRGSLAPQGGRFGMVFVQQMPTTP